MADRSRLRVFSRALRFVVGLAVLAAAVGLFWSLVATRPKPLEHPASDRVLTVRTVTATPVPVARVWDGYGTARAMDSADISSEASARVVERPDDIEPGMPVMVGQLIVRLDPTDFEQRIASLEQSIAAWEAALAGLDVELRRWSDQLELAQDEADVAERELERMVEARAAGAGTETEEQLRRARLARAQRDAATLRQQIDLVPSRRDQTQAQLIGARADLRLAQEQLSRATIRSPIDGVLQRVDAEEGEFLTVGSPVARIVNLARIEVPLRLPVSAVGSVAVGDRVELRSDGAAAHAWTGSVERIAPEADQGTRTIVAFAVVRQEIPDRNAGDRANAAALLPGQFVVARVETSVRLDRILVPRRAVDGDAVMVIDEISDPPRARRMPVRVAMHMEGRYPQLDPAETQWAALEPVDLTGRRIITSNLDELRDGTPVRTSGTATAESQGPAIGGGP